MIQTLRRILYGSDHVQWCGDLCGTDHTFRMAITDLPASQVAQLVDDSATKEEFRDSVIAAWE